MKEMIMKNSSGCSYLISFVDKVMRLANKQGLKVYLECVSLLFIMKYFVHTKLCVYTHIYTQCAYIYIIFLSCK